MTVDQALDQADAILAAQLQMRRDALLVRMVEQGVCDDDAREVLARQAEIDAAWQLEQRVSLREQFRANGLSD